MQTATINLPQVLPYQAEHIFNPARIVIIEASTKSGKTAGCIIWQAAQVLSDRLGREHWWIAPVYAQAAIAYKRAKRMLPPELYSANDSERVLKFVNGATWSFKSAEKPDNLYGDDVASAVFDEATRGREDAWHAVRSTLTATRGPIRIIGNVKGRKNWVYRLARRAEAGAQGMHYAKITARDAVAAGLFTQAELEAAGRDLPERIFRELYYAEASDDEGNPFGLTAIRECIGPMSKAAPVSWGVDLAKSVDWTVAVGLDADGAVCRFLRFQRPWRETTQAISEAVGNLPAYVDSTGVGDPVVEALQRERRKIEGFKFTSTSKQQLMEGLALAIQRRDVTIPAGPITAELEMFEYEYTRTGVRYSAPDGEHDDCVMALALAVACHKRPRAAWRPASTLAVEAGKPDPNEVWIPAA